MKLLDKAFGRENEAARQLAQAKAERERLESNQRLWSERLSEIKKFQERLARATEEVGNVRAETLAFPAIIVRQLGQEGMYTQPAGAVAAECAKAMAALPLMEAAERTLIQQFRAFIAETRELGVKLGVPENELASLVPISRR
jgi:hypothetical protein